jgi:hypothetical protein
VPLKNGPPNLCAKLIRVEGLAVLGSEDLEDTGRGFGKRVRERDLKIQNICEKDRREIVEAWQKSCWITALLAQVLLGVALSNIDKKAVSSHLHLINWRAWVVLWIAPASRTSHMLPTACSMRLLFFCHNKDCRL